jgi:hypothetical protein
VDEILPRKDGGAFILRWDCRGGGHQESNPTRVFFVSFPPM